MAGKKGRDKPEPKAKPEAKRGKQVPKATPAAPKAAAASTPASNAPAAATPAAAEKPKVVPQSHGIPMAARGSKFFGAPNQGKRPGPRVPPAHPVHMPTGNRRGG